jgi:hypothetical protein
MRRVALTYAAAAIWLFGWMTGTFDLFLSVVTSLVSAAPIFVWWRMSARNQPIKRREYLYLAILTILALVGTAFLVAMLFNTGRDRIAIFDREYYAFCREIRAMPEFKNVETSYTNEKMGRMYLKGNVASKDSHDRLIEMVRYWIRYGGYSDDVDYPGKN